VIRRALRGFGGFWWNFLIGDTPEFFFVTSVVVVVAYALHRERTVGVIVLPVIVLGALALSTLRVRARK
jgi:hypothetical protein